MPLLKAILIAWLLLHWPRLLAYVPGLLLLVAGLLIILRRP